MGLIKLLSEELPDVSKRTEAIVNLAFNVRHPEWHLGTILIGYPDRLLPSEPITSSKFSQ